MPRKAPTATIPSFQTVRLKRGRHISPEHGACVMELASMLAGERFTDRPHSVSPVVAEFLRTYNDLVDQERRQDLFRFASESVGTRSSRATERLRAECIPDSGHGGFFDRLARSLSSPARRRAARAKRVAAVLAMDPTRHEDALALAHQLIAVGRSRDVASARELSSPRVQSRMPMPSIARGRSATRAES